VVPVPASSGVLPPEVSVVAPEDAPGVPDIDEKKIYIYIYILFCKCFDRCLPFSLKEVDVSSS
jgi:hypothetical protein